MVKSMHSMVKNMQGMVKNKQSMAKKHEGQVAKKSSSLVQIRTQGWPSVAMHRELPEC